MKQMKHQSKQISCSLNAENYGIFAKLADEWECPISYIVEAIIFRQLPDIQSYKEDVKKIKMSRKSGGLNSLYPFSQEEVRKMRHIVKDWEARNGPLS